MELLRSPRFKLPKVEFESWRGSSSSTIGIDDHRTAWSEEPSGCAAERRSPYRLSLKLAAAENQGSLSSDVWPCARCRNITSFMLHYVGYQISLFLRLLCHITLSFWRLDTPKRFSLLQSSAPAIPEVDERIKHFEKFVCLVETKGIVAIG